VMESEAGERPGGHNVQQELGHLPQLPCWRRAGGASTTTSTKPQMQMEGRLCRDEAEEIKCHGCAKPTPYDGDRKAGCRVPCSSSTFPIGLRDSTGADQSEASKSNGRGGHRNSREEERYPRRQEHEGWGKCDGLAARRIRPAASAEGYVRRIEIVGLLAERADRRLRRPTAEARPLVTSPGRGGHPHRSSPTCRALTNNHNVSAAVYGCHPDPAVALSPGADRGGGIGARPTSSGGRDEQSRGPFAGP